MKLVVSWCTGMNTALWSPWHFLLSPSRIFAHKCIFCVSQAMCDCPFWLMFLLYGTVHRFQHVMIVPAVCGLDVVLYMAHMEFWANWWVKAARPSTKWSSIEAITCQETCNLCIILVKQPLVNVYQLWYNWWQHFQSRFNYVTERYSKYPFCRGRTGLIGVFQQCVIHNFKFYQFFDSLQVFCGISQCAQCSTWSTI